MSIGYIFFKYLGIPVNCVRLCNSDRDPTLEKVEKKVGPWKSKLHSYGGGLILLRSCLTNIPFLMMSMFELPKGPKNSMDIYRKIFFHQEGEDTKKVHLVNWELFAYLKIWKAWVCSRSYYYEYLFIL